MPAVPYPPGDPTPPDSRWDWYLPVPGDWLGFEPEQVMRYAQYVLAHVGITHNGGPAELSAQQHNGDWYFLIKSDVDPATVIDPNNLPAPPKTPHETRIERLTLARTKLRGGTPLTATETQEAILHLIEGYLDAVT